MEASERSIGSNHEYEPNEEWYTSFFYLKLTMVFHYLFAHFSTSLADVVRELRKQIKSDECEIVVRRAHVLEDALKRAGRMSFDPTHSIVVSL